MKAKLELKEKTDKELASLAAEKRETLRGIRFGTAGHVRDAFAARKHRKDIARILTEQNRRTA